MEWSTTPIEILPDCSFCWTEKQPMNNTSKQAKQGHKILKVSTELHTWHMNIWAEQNSDFKTSFELFYFTTRKSDKTEKNRKMNRYRETPSYHFSRKKMQLQIDKVGYKKRREYCYTYLYLCISYIYSGKWISELFRPEFFSHSHKRNDRERSTKASSTTTTLALLLLHKRWRFSEQWLATNGA